MAERTGYVPEVVNSEGSAKIGLLTSVAIYCASTLIYNVELGAFRRGRILTPWETLGAGIPNWKLISWYLLAAHKLQMTFSRGTRSVSRSAFTFEDFGYVDGTLFYLAVILLLMAGGYVLARRAPVDGRGTVSDSFVAGGAIAIGYLPAIVLVTIASSHSTGEYAIYYDPVRSALIAGILYPVVFGGIGGVAYHRYGRETDDDLEVREPA